MSAGLSSPPVALPQAGFSLRRLIGPVVQPRAFALSEPMNVIRLMAGLFYLPHILFKLNGMAGSMAFFTKAGLVPAPLFLGLALLTESLSFLCLTFGLFTRWAGLMSAGCMLVAVYATAATKGLGWTWNTGGVEYLVFWGVASLMISLHAFRQQR
ncbi:DoxX family protein [Acetobacteraceae bacterium H6797]|nr:DoxX family protein [Acetobacteraceae bacterium H6797]